MTEQPVPPPLPPGVLDPERLAAHAYDRDPQTPPPPDAEAVLTTVLAGLRYVRAECDHLGPDAADLAGRVQSAADAVAARAYGDATGWQEGPCAHSPAGHGYLAETGAPDAQIRRIAGRADQLRALLAPARRHAEQRVPPGCELSARELLTAAGNALDKAAEFLEIAHDALMHATATHHQTPQQPPPPLIPGVR